MTKLKLALASAALVIGGISGLAFAGSGAQRRDPAARIAKLDRNGDGKLDDRERAAARATRRAQRIAKLDRDGDGKLDDRERAAARAQRIAKHDRNGDGTLDDRERAAARDARIERRFAKLDANRDGAISLDELKAGKHGRGRHHRGRE
jgi:EF hand